MVRATICSLIMLLTLSVRLSAAACTPLGDGDDTGCVPPDKPIAKCENGVASALATLAGRLTKCNIRDSDAKAKVLFSGGSCLSNDLSFDGVACQVAARTSYDGRVAKLTACPPCLDVAAVRDAMSQFVNLHNDLAYCTPASGCAEDIGQPVQDATGYLPIPLGKQCENREAKTVSKLTVALLRCHVSSARAQGAGKPFDEEGCEVTAEAKYDASTAKFGIDCPGCLTFGGYATARDLVHSLIDGQSGGPYCASPSGAFVVD